MTDSALQRVRVAVVTIDDWLGRIGLTEYARAFRENGVDMGILPELTADDLKEIGVVAVGHRRKLLAEIAELKGGEEAASLTQRGDQEHSGDRRHVAVLFADLVGFTNLTEKLGAEAIHGILDTYFSRADKIIERHGGRVDKHIGDCVMGVFGAPVAHGNDAERAVHAALEIRSDIAQLSVETGQALNIHIGVTTGVVVASLVGSGKYAEYAVTGESVNMASRLTDEARPGEILIAEDLHRILEGKLAAESTGELCVKGVAAPIHAWSVHGLANRHGRSGPFVGRRAELRQFESILSGCKEDKTGQVVLLRGEAGIGKTRLSEEFEQIAKREGFLVRRGLVLDFGNETGRDAVRAIIKDIFEIDAQAGHDQLQCVARAAVVDGIIDAKLEPHLIDLLDAPQPSHLRARFDAMDNSRHVQGRGEAIAHIVRWAAEQKPLLLIVEDAHWARGPLLRAIAQVAQAVADCPTVLVISTRLEGDPLDREWRSTITNAAITTMDLSPLRTEEAKAICESLINDTSRVEKLISRAGGNPLFLEQLTRRSQRDEVEVIPGSIQSLVQSNVDQLSPLDRSTIQAAAVVGQKVDASLLKHLVGEREIDFARLVEKNFLRPHGINYLFVHALIRDAIYESLLTPTRVSLHQRAADWFADRDQKLHAEHLALANAQEAARAFWTAARTELVKYHYETALALIERGLAVAELPDDLVDLRLLEGETWLDFGKMPEAGNAFSSALAGATDTSSRSRALIGLAGVKRVTDDIEGALVDLDEAEAAALEAELQDHLARIHFLRGNLLFPKGDLDGCHREHEAGLHYARQSGRSDLEAASLGGVGDAQYVRGFMADARKRLEECVRIASAQGLGRIEVANQAQTAHTMLYTGCVKDAYEAAQSAILAAQSVGHGRAEINAGMAAAFALLLQGKYLDCLQQVKRVDHCIEILGATRFRQSTLMCGGRALQALGRVDEAISALREGVEFARSNGFAFHGPSIASGLAIAVPDPAEKIELINEAFAACRSGCVGHNQFFVYATGIDVAMMLKDAEMLRRFGKLATEYPANEEIAWRKFQKLRYEALLRRLEQGDTAEVQSALRALKGDSESLAMRYWALDIQDCR